MFKEVDLKTLTPIDRLGVPTDREYILALNEVKAWTDYNERHARDISQEYASMVGEQYAQEIAVLTLLQYLRGKSKWMN